MSGLPAIALEEARRVRSASEAELDLLLADLEAWVNVDTPGGDASALDRLGAMLAHRLEEYGLHPELVPAGEEGLYLHAGLEGSGRARVALLCHHDTVYPHGTAAARPFRRGATRCHGPGVADMKGGIAVAAHAARLLALGPRPFARLELVSAPDEESRPAEPATIDRLLDFDAVLCMECGRPAGEVVSARKGARWFRLHAQGRPAHAGVEPDVGRNAAVAICREAVRLTELHGAREGLTFQVTELQGGEGPNTVPSRASLTGDLRAVTAADLSWALARVGSFESHPGCSARSTITRADRSRPLRQFRPGAPRPPPRRGRRRRRSASRRSPSPRTRRACGRARRPGRGRRGSGRRARPSTSRRRRRP